MTTRLATARTASVRLLPELPEPWNERYEIINVLKESTTSSQASSHCLVYLARDKENNNKSVVIKTSAPDDQSTIEEVIREYEIIHDLEHPGVVNVDQLIINAHQAGIVMEHLEHSLVDFLRYTRRDGKRLSPAFAMGELVTQLVA